MSRGRAAVLGARLWGAYARAHVEASARLMLEGRHYGQPGRVDWPAPGFEDWCSGGILFDDLSVALKRVGGTPLTLKLGRQAILLGNGWLVLDGNPIDGSRTIYFDGARATSTGLPADTNLALIYIGQSTDAVRFPALLNGGDDQVEQDECGLLLYARSRGLRIDADLYTFLIYNRHERFCGHLLTGWLKAKLARQISGHLVAEYSSPGDLYMDHRQDESHFIRAEINLTW